MIVALLLPTPPLTNSPPQLFAMKRNATLRALRHQFLAGVFHELIDVIIHLQSHNLSPRHNLVDCRLRSYCLKPHEVTFDNAFRPKILPSRSEGSLGDPIPRIFDHLAARNDVEVIFPNYLRVRLVLPLSHYGSFVVSVICLNTNFEKRLIPSDQAMLAELVLNTD
ncbi:hypothetical protein AVEN_172505-1 [Araneus ventricosus]|uniref:Uncharacterized protein n=1 Tax=Araneus ventricosus TaxID=182803 RepID=A0A4Y2DSB2_ARAVE|nr:hypothetical protein AVEN_172505-1 [Araneus ventricosus]